MGLSNLGEPALIVLGFTVSSLFNSRELGDLFAFWRWDYEPINLSTPARKTYLPCFGWGWNIRIPDTTPYRHTLVSRLLWHVPFLIEIWYWNLMYWIYQGARAISAVHLSPETPAIATIHGEAILAFEQRLHLAPELYVQQYFLSKNPSGMVVLAKIYYSHIALGVAFIGYMYSYRPDVFPAIRRSMAVANALAFAVMTLYRVAPPRLLPKSYGFIDVLHSGQDHTAWTQNRFQLIYAAMPSLHFGNSLLVGISLLCFAPHRPLRIFGLIWPAAMLTTILATANHYLLDALAGACVVGLAWRLNRVMLALRPLEEWGYWLCHVHKPLRMSEHVVRVEEDRVNRLT